MHLVVRPLVLNILFLAIRAYCKVNIVIWMSSWELIILVQLFTVWKEFFEDMDMRH